MSTPSPDSGSGPVARVCQRCRRSFPGDATLQPGTMIEWWACDDCRAVLGLADTSAAAPSGAADAPTDATRTAGAR